MGTSHTHTHTLLARHAYEYTASFAMHRVMVGMHVYACMQKRIHTHTHRVHVWQLDVYLGRVFSRRAHYVHAASASLAVYMFIYSPLGPQCARMYMYLRHGF
jgi:hypothetical protein